jgi:hypothetical protein
LDNDGPKVRASDERPGEEMAVLRKSLPVGLLVALAVFAPIGRASGENWADSLFKERNHEFGVVARGAKVRHLFLLTNRLSEEITILSLRPSCGCTTGKASTASIAPGKTATIEAEMDTRNFVGDKATSLYVSLVTANGREGEVRLGVSSTILSDIVLNPGSIDFGTVGRGQSPTRTLIMERIGAPNWEVERMVSACRAINASLDETRRANGLVEYTLTVTLKPDAPAGLLHDEIRFLTNDPETRSISVNLNAQVRGDLSASPSMVSLGRVTSAAGAFGHVWIRGSKPFAVTATEGSGNGFSIAADDTSRKPLHRITVSYKPEEGTTRGDLRRNFQIHTDLPGEPPVGVTAAVHADP